MLKRITISVLKVIGIYEWQKNWRKVPVSVRLTNFIFQRILRLNGNCPWSVNFTSRVIHPKNISLSTSAKTFMALSGHCYINGQNGIAIGEGTIIAPGVKILSANHRLENYQEHTDNPPVNIGKNCWLGANSIILPGVILKDNVIVAAGAVVTKSFESNCILAGVPARKIRSLN